MGWIIQNRPKLWVLHRVIALVVLLPATIIFFTGFLLQVREYVPWVQPTSIEVGSKTPHLAFDKVLLIGKSIPEAAINSWKDVHSIDVRPNKGLLRLRSKNNFEIQLNVETGEILHKGIRRTGFLISLHEGTWFGPVIKNSIFLLSSILFCVLLASGTILLIPHIQQSITPRKKLRYAKSQ